MNPNLFHFILNILYPFLALLVSYFEQLNILKTTFCRRIISSPPGTDCEVVFFENLWLRHHSLICNLNSFLGLVFVGLEQSDLWYDFLSLVKFDWDAKIFIQRIAFQVLTHEAS